MNLISLILSAFSHVNSCLKSEIFSNKEFFNVDSLTSKSVFKPSVEDIISPILVLNVILLTFKAYLSSSKLSCTSSNLLYEYLISSFKDSVFLVIELLILSILLELSF